MEKSNLHPIASDELERISDCIKVLQAKCDIYEAALKEIRGDGQKFMPAKQDILLIIKEALSAGEGEKEGKEIEYMPVHPEDARIPGCPRQVPMRLLNEDQAQYNHGQSLKRLKERGGLSITEMLAIIQRRKWQSIKWDDAIKMLNDILYFNKSLDAFSPIIEPKNKLDEPVFIEAVVLGIEQMTRDQKSRFMNFIYSTYWMFITIKQLNK